MLQQVKQLMKGYKRQAMQNILEEWSGDNLGDKIKSLPMSSLVITDHEIAIFDEGAVKAIAALREQMTQKNLTVKH